MAIKYQSQIHKAFADSLDKEAKEKFDLLIEANPELANVADFKQSPEAAAISSSNLDICKYFFYDEEKPFKFSGDNKERVKTVAQTVRANVVAYNNFVNFEKAEEEDKQEDFLKIYKSLIKNLDEYFSIAAEYALKARHGDSYIDFAKNFTEEEEERQAARVAKRKAKSDSKNSED